MKIWIYLFSVALVCLTSLGQTNGFWLHWQQPSDGRTPLLYEVCHGNAQGVFTRHPHATFLTNQFIPFNALWEGDNYFSVTAVDTALKSDNFTLEPRETDYANWVVIRKLPALILSGSTNNVYESSTNLVDWYMLTNTQPILPLLPQQFFRKPDGGVIFLQHTNIYDVNNSP